MPARVRRRDVPAATQSEVCAAWVELLTRHPWHWFTTLTFKPKHQLRSGGMHPEKADKAFRHFINELNRSTYGNNWRRAPHGGVVWARGQEFHKSGRVHFHAVLAAPDGDLNDLASRYRWHEWWYREFGRNQIERPRSLDEVAGYVSKYTAKDGEVDMSPNFGKARPPTLEFFGGGMREVGFPRTSPTPADEPLSTPGRKEQSQPRGEGLSLTLPVRPQFVFTDESFFEIPSEPESQPET